LDGSALTDEQFSIVVPNLKADLAQIITNDSFERFAVSMYPHSRSSKRIIDNGGFEDNPAGPGNNNWVCPGACRGRAG